MHAAPADPRQPVGLLTDHLLVQAEPHDLDDAVRLADREGSGLVISGTNAVASCKMTWRNAFSRPVLTDRRRYAGNARHRGTEPLSDAWLSDQKTANVTAILSDSGYIGERDERALKSVLYQTARAGAQVVAVLPLHISWLGSGVACLTREVNEHGVPVALVLEHKNDPLGTQWAVRGLVEFLRRAEVPVSLLSSDVSSLGGIAFGAVWSAVGVRSKLRHLYPAGSSFSVNPSLSALVRPMLSMVSVQKIAEAWARTQEDPDWVQDIWTCTCWVCQSRTLDWLATASTVEVNAHTFGLLADMRDGLASLPGGWVRARSWTSKCRAAISRYEQLRMDQRVGWTTPGYLRSWATQRET
jgi:hypothetical protein